MVEQSSNDPQELISQSGVARTRREWGVWTWPNLITLIRLACLPIFLWLLLGRDDRASAGWLLLALGGTDWVDGWVARRFNQVSEFGKMFDPTADRLLFIVGLTAIMVDGSAPRWFCILVLIREVLFGGTIAILTLFFSMERFDVTYLGKWATFLLMGVFPAFVLGESDIGIHLFFTISAWIAGPIGLILSYYTAIVYLPFMITQWPATNTVSKEAALSLVALGIFCTALAFISFFIVMKEIGPARASIGTYVNTAVAVVLGVLILSEPLTLGIIIGLPLVMIGSYLASRKPSVTS